MGWKRDIRRDTEESLADLAAARTNMAKAVDDDLRSLTAKPAAQAASTTPTEPSSFGAAFKAARAAQGAGKTFTWRGKSYSTNLAGEAAKPKPAVRAAPKADAPSAKTAAPAVKPKASNIDTIARKGAALRAALSKAPAKSEPRAKRPSLAAITATDIAGRKRKLSPEQTRKLEEARQRSGTRTSGFAKGGSVDGCAVRGKTKLKRT